MFVCMFGTGKQIKTTQNKHPNLCLSCGVVESVCNWMKESGCANFDLCFF